MATIYDMHDKAFPRVSAYVIARNGERVATLAFKFPADGAGRLHCFLHWAGLEMVRGYAGGYGYDKLTAAACSAAGRMPGELPVTAYADGTPHHSPAEREAFAAFRAALDSDSGYDWARKVSDAGFAVWQAV